MTHDFNPDQHCRDNYELKNGSREQGRDKMFGKKYVYTNAIIEPIGLNEDSE
jgi:hypothetical protein